MVTGRYAALAHLLESLSMADGPPNDEESNHLENESTRKTMATTYYQQSEVII